MDPVTLVRPAYTLVLAFLLCFQVSQPARAADAESRLLELGDGYRVSFVGAGEIAAKVANPKMLYMDVALLDQKTFDDRARLIEAADRVFEAVLLNAAEKGYYTRARVNVRAVKGGALEDFTYARGTNEVWLRQAGQVAWKKAQDPAWTPAKSEKIDFKGLGTIWVEPAVELPPPDGFKRAVEIDLVTKTPIISVQQKYKEIKALWGQIDRDGLLKQGYDMVMVGNFSTPQLGRFHARRGFFVRIPKSEEGKWAELPDRVPDDRETMISKNELPVDELTKSIRLTFANGLDTMRLTDVIVPGLDAQLGTGTAQVGFGESTPVVRLDAMTFDIKLP